jgi:hypothetical protein
MSENKKVGLVKLIESYSQEKFKKLLQILEPGSNGYLKILTMNDLQVYRLRPLNGEIPSNAKELRDDMHVIENIIKKDKLLYGAKNKTFYLLYDDFYFIISGLKTENNVAFALLLVFFFHDEYFSPDIIPEYFKEKIFKLFNGISGLIIKPEKLKSDLETEICKGYKKAITIIEKRYLRDI